MLSCPLHRDAGKTAFEMGHLNANLLYEHYRELVSKTEAEKFWDIRPERTTPAIRSFGPA